MFEIKLLDVAGRFQIDNLEAGSTSAASGLWLVYILSRDHAT